MIIFESDLSFSLGEIPSAEKLAKRWYIKDGTIVRLRRTKDKTLSPEALKAGGKTSSSPCNIETHQVKSLDAVHGDIRSQESRLGVKVFESPPQILNYDWSLDSTNRIKMKICQSCGLKASQALIRRTGDLGIRHRANPGYGIGVILSLTIKSIQLKQNQTSRLHSGDYVIIAVSANINSEDWSKVNLFASKIRNCMVLDSRPTVGYRLVFTTIHRK